VVRHEQSYAFDDEEALARLRALTDYWSAKHGVHTEWKDFTAHLAGRKMGVKYRADVQLREGKLTAQVEVGFLAEKLGGPAYVRRKVADYLDPANSLASLRARVPH